MRLLIFSGAQAPLPVRYPHPSKPRLTLPPLVHRSLHTALDAQPPSAQIEAGQLIIPHPSALNKHTGSEDNEVTIKIQVTGGEPSTYLHTIREALGELASRKGLVCIDTALIGLPEDTDGKARSGLADSRNGLGRGMGGGLDCNVASAALGHYRTA